MHYALLIYASEDEWQRMGRAQRQAIMNCHVSAARMENDAGSLIAGFRLLPTHHATTVRATAKGVTTVDGPFAETKEQLGGLQILDCQSMDQAVRFARQLVESGGTVEIRPLHDNLTSID